MLKKLFTLRSVLITITATTAFKVSISLPVHGLFCWELNGWVIPLINMRNDIVTISDVGRGSLHLTGLL